jgi:hypothetical protein
MAEANMGGSSSPPTADRQSEYSDCEVITLDDDTSLEDALFQKQGGEKPAALDNDTFVQTIKDYYPKDKLFMLILEKPKEYTNFFIREDIIQTTNPRGDEVVCVPRNRELITQLIDQAHAMLGHFGDQRTAEYLRHWYWWPQITMDVREFCRTCESCQ